MYIYIHVLKQVQTSLLHNSYNYQKKQILVSSSIIQPNSRNKFMFK